jgi:hypothetical protein
VQQQLGGKGGQSQVLESFSESGLVVVVVD